MSREACGEAAAPRSGFAPGKRSPHSTGTTAPRLSCRARRTRDRQRVGRFRPRAKPSPLHQLRHDERERLIERAEAGHAKHRVFRLAIPPAVRIAAGFPAAASSACLSFDKLPSSSPSPRPASASIDMGAEIVDDLRHGVADAHPARLVELSPVGVRLRELEALDQNFLVIGGERLVLEIGLRLLGRLDRISGQHALVGQLGGRKHRLVAEHHVEEFQPVDMAAENREANRQRRCEHEADRAPQPGPERRRRRRPRPAKARCFDRRRAAR